VKEEGWLGYYVCLSPFEVVLLQKKNRSEVKNGPRGFKESEIWLNTLISII
jgi:hypothetical protein